jgi:phosphoglucomutase
MKHHPLAGQPVTPDALVDVPALVTAYFTQKPDPNASGQRVAFGTSGHRGSALRKSFNEAHILATTQAIVDLRNEEGVTGPLFLGVDTHALSEPARVTALEVLAANKVEVRIDENDGYTPTPAVSHAILSHNRNGSTGAQADGIVITPSHNPPEDGGFKYNPPHGGPADTEFTSRIEARANQLLSEDLEGVKRISYERALIASTTKRYDYREAFVRELPTIVDLDAIRSSRIKIGVDPLGGAGVHYWHHIADRFALDIEVVNASVDPTFRFMTRDWDGKIRMDCSSPYAMTKLIELKDRFDVAFANDADNDRHGIVTKSVGLMNPNHYLSAAIDYLFRERAQWNESAAVGKTLVTSAMVDRVAKRLGRTVVEVPVGFKWFVEGLRSGTLGFGGEESAGAAFLRQDGSVWTTDKDGLTLGLLAAEMMARAGRDPGELYRGIVAELGESFYERIDSPATPEQKAALKKLSPDRLEARELAGETIVSAISNAPGNGAPIGGLKISTENGWFAARPSGTEDVYKLYAESFVSEEHLRLIQSEAQALLSAAFGAG